MANNENLIPQAHTLTVEEQTKGGVESGKSRREQKTLRKCLEVLLAAKTQDKKTLKVLEAAGVPVDEATMKYSVTFGLVKAAISGDVKAFREIERMIEEDKPDEYKKLDEILARIEGNI